MDRFAKLREFLANEANQPGVDPHLILAALDKTLPILTCMKPDSGTLEPLYEPRHGADAEVVKAALTSALGENVKRVILVPLETFLPQPEWMSSEIYDHLWDIAWSALCEDTLGPTVHYVLEDAFEKDLDREDDRITDLEEILRDTPLNSANDVLREFLFYYLALAITGDSEDVKRLTPLIEFLPYGLPLGEKEGESGTWIVLTA